MEQILKISLMVFALWYCFQEGEIFGAAQKIKLGWFADPFRDCPVCMVPWYGSLAYWIFFHGSLGNYLLTIICSLGLNAVVTRFFPDRDTPGLHQELGDIHESLVDIGQTIKPLAQAREEKQLQEKQNKRR